MAVAAAVASLFLAGCVSSPPAAVKPPPPFVDYETVEDWPELVGESQAIVVADTTGVWTTKATTEPATLDYIQVLHVDTVLKGPAQLDGGNMSVVRLGLSGSNPHGGQPGHEVYGPLTAGRHLLFLIPSGRPGMWSIVGHWQGDMKMNGDVVTGPTFDTFSNVDVSEVKALIKQVAPK